MCIVMADQGPHLFPQPGYSQEDYTPQSTVSSFNLPMVYSSSTLTTPVSLTMDSSLNAPKFNTSQGHWEKNQQMNYPQIIPRDQRSRMKSNSKDTTLSVHTNAQFPEQPQVGLGITSPPFYDPSTAAPPYTPQFYSGVSAPSVITSPAASSNYPAASQFHPNTPTTWNQPPATTYTTMYSQPQAPVLAQPTPPFMRKRSHEVLKQKPGQSQFQHRPAPMHHSASPSFYAKRKSESPPLALMKRRKASDPSHFDSHSELKYHQPQVFSLPPPMGCNPTPETDHQGTRHQSTSSSYGRMSQNPLSENEQLLLNLRCREPALDWKKTAQEYNMHTGQEKKVPALQMMCTRAKEKQKVWSEKDIAILKKVKAADDKEKWKRIAVSLAKEGAEEKWSDIACKRQWAIIAPEGDDDGLAADQPSPGRDEYEEQQVLPPLCRNLSYPQPSFVQPFAPPSYQFNSNFRAGPERRESPLGRIREGQVGIDNRPQQQLLTTAQNLALQLHEAQRYELQNQSPRQRQLQQQQPSPPPYGVENWQVKPEGN